MSLIGFLIIGGLAGWLAGFLFRGGGYGILANMGIGVAGSIIGGFIFRLLGLSSHSVIGELVTATVGALVLLAVVRAVKRA